jgi:hypothetical protein
MMEIIVRDLTTHIEVEFSGDISDQRFTLPVGEVSLILGSDAVYITAGKLPGNSKKNIELRLPYDKVVTPSRASNLLLYDTIQGYITG